MSESEPCALCRAVAGEPRGEGEVATYRDRAPEVWVGCPSAVIAFTTRHVRDTRAKSPASRPEPCGNAGVDEKEKSQGVRSGLNTRAHARRSVVLLRQPIRACGFKREHAIPDSP